MRARSMLPIAALALLLASACGPQLGSGPSDDVDADPAAPDAQPGSGAECETTPQCQGRLVCDTESGACSDSLPCTEHADCGDAAHCRDDGTCRKSQTGSPCDDESDCFGGDDCFGGFCGCEGTSFVAEPVPVNMLMVLDRSNSMHCDMDDPEGVGGIPHTDPNSRWQVALGAIDVLLDDYDDAINFGLAVYPGLGQGQGDTDRALCDDSTPGDACFDETSTACSLPTTIADVDPDASDSSATIRQALSETAPGGCTPSAAALQAQLDYEPLQNPGAENYVLYITDGAENCGHDQTFNQVTVIEDLRAQDPEIRTFVVGFTEDVNPAELNDAADAGGMARDEPGVPRYYQANDATALESALEEIGGLALSCSFTLDSVPPDLDDLFVYVGNQSIIRDPDQENGWDYDLDTNRITLYGGACDAAQSGAAEDVNIVHGCPIDVE